MTREGRNSFALGPDKPLGSQGFPLEAKATLRKLSFPHKLFDLLDKSDYAVPADRTRKCSRLWSGSVGQIWLYVWDDEALTALLAQAKWPQAPEVFVQWTRENLVRPLTAGFDLIADAYGDKTNAGRSDVLPGISRGEMLTAFKRKHGFQDDMSWLYLNEAKMIGEV